MIEYIILAVIKICDNIISTVKNLATYREEKILSSVLVVISQLLFYLVIGRVINDNTMLAIVIVSVSSGLGNFLAFSINDRFKKDEKWSMVLTSSDKNDVIKLCGYLTACKIKYVANHGLTRKGEETIHILAFSRTKEESRMIEKYLEKSNSKYMKEVI